MTGTPVDPIERYRSALDDAERGGELLRKAIGVLTERVGDRAASLATEIERLVGRVEGMILLECPAARRRRVKRMGGGAGP